MLKQRIFYKITIVSTAIVFITGFVKEDIYVLYGIINIKLPKRIMIDII